MLHLAFDTQDHLVYGCNSQRRNRPIMHQLTSRSLIAMLSSAFNPRWLYIFWTCTNIYFPFVSLAFMLGPSLAFHCKKWHIFKVGANGMLGEIWCAQLLSFIKSQTRTVSFIRIRSNGNGKVYIQFWMHGQNAWTKRERNKEYKQNCAIWIRDTETDSYAIGSRHFSFKEVQSVHFSPLPRDRGGPSAAAAAAGHKDFLGVDGAWKTIVTWMNTQKKYLSLPIQLCQYNCFLCLDLVHSPTHLCTLE